MTRRDWYSRLALFVLVAWPAWVVSVPPLQDLPNHLATAYVQSHLGQYPELVSNGFFKTNTTLFLFLHLASKVVSLRMAAKLFVTLVALVGAFAYPATARAFGKNERSATLVLWAMVHNWFVAMGMLDYALSVPLALLALVALDHHRREPSFARGLAAAGLALLVWYTHAFAVLMLLGLVGIEAVVLFRERAEWRQVTWRFALPLLPAVALTAWSVVLQLGSEARVVGFDNLYQGVPSLVYEAWAEWLWPLTKWTLASLACALVLAWYGARHFRARLPFFSPLAMAALLAAYALLPYQGHRWFHVNTRVLPFLWMGCALRVPTELPRWLSRALVMCALSFSAGLGVEYVETSHDWDEVALGEPYVPVGARLLPIVFDRKGPHGDNTWPMLHVWGLYVVDRGVTTPLLFAHSKSFPISYAVPPPERFHSMNFERFPEVMKSERDFCDELRSKGVIRDDCGAVYKETWSELWNEARRLYTHILLYGASRDVLATVPAFARVLYDHEETVVLALQ